MKISHSLMLTALLSSFTLSGWAEQTHPSEPITVSKAWARALPANAPAGAVYLELHNHSHEPDQLTSASSDIAQSVELHETSEQDGMLKMAQAQSFEVLADGHLSLKPGGKHVMLFGLNRPLVAGEQFNLSLDFANAGPQQVTVDVLETAPQNVSESTQHHH